MKILFPSIMFALLFVSFLPSVMAQPELFGRDLREEGSWSEDVDIMKEIDAATARTSNPTHYADTKSLMFATSYINMGKVQNLYFGLESWKWELTNQTRQGTAPLQLLIQRYHAVGGKDVIALNAFTGLVAYRNNESNIYGRPDKNSDLYYGWTLYGELLKNYTNGILENYFGVPDGDQFAKDQVGASSRIWNNASATSITFGMSYTDLFVFWQKVDIAVEPNDTAGAPEAVFGRAVAVSILDSLNFSYTLTSQDLADGRTAVKTTTSYEIGNITDLWVREASYLNCSEFGVPVYNYNFGGAIGNVTLAHYNSTTTTTASQRLNGTDTSHGFSLGVMNYAVILALDTFDKDDTWDDGTIDDGTAPAVNDTSNRSVQQLSLRLAKRAAKAYNIDFASKPTYEYNGGAEVLPSPTFVYPKLKIGSNITRSLWDGMKWIVRKLWGSNFLGNYQDRIETAYVGDLVYITCFPKWSGLSCVQDPTFTAFTSLQGSIPWFLIIGIAGVAVVILVVSLVIRNRRKRLQ